MNNNKPEKENEPSEFTNHEEEVRMRARGARASVCDTVGGSLTRNDILNKNRVMLTATASFPPLLYSLRCSSYAGLFVFCAVIWFYLIKVSSVAVYIIRPTVWFAHNSIYHRFPAGNALLLH